MLDAGGAGTYTQRAIPGSEPGLDSCAQPRYTGLARAFGFDLSG